MREMTENVTVIQQNWKVGDTVVSNITDFNITKGKEYQILRRDVFYDCFFIINDAGEEESYSDCYFYLNN